VSIFSTDWLISGLILHAVLAAGAFEACLPEGLFVALPADTAPLLFLTALRAEDFFAATFLAVFLAVFLAALFAVFLPADFFACSTVTFRAGFFMLFVFALFVLLAFAGMALLLDCQRLAMDETTQEPCRIDAGQTTLPQRAAEPI
jgi:hypothetical protein